MDIKTRSILKFRVQRKKALRLMIQKLEQLNPHVRHRSEHIEL